jgi:hypothetical protein
MEHGDWMIVGIIALLAMTFAVPLPVPIAVLGTLLVVGVVFSLPTPNSVPPPDSIREHAAQYPIIRRFV